MKRQPGWEKIVVNDITNKELIFKIYKQLIELIQLYQKKKQSYWKNEKTGIDIFLKKTNRWPTECGKLLKIINHDRNANQNHNELSPYTC